MQSIAYFSFGLAALSYSVLAILLLTSWRGKPQGAVLIVASAAQILWAVINLVAFSKGFSQLALYVFVAEVLRTATWYFFIGHAFDKSGHSPLQTVLGWSTYVIPIVILYLGFHFNYADFFSLTPYIQDTSLVFYLMLYNLFGLILLEQLYRNNSEDNRWRIKFLVFALSASFCYDFILYTYTYLMQEVEQELWLAKGVVAAAITPFIAISAARNPHWSLDVHVSRKVAFYTSSFFIAGIYLLVMGIGGFYVRQLGGTWGVFLQAIFLTLAGLSLLILVFSGSVRAWLKVFINKHFYNYKYDYRDEWLRLMRIMSTRDESLTVQEKAIKSLAPIVESPSGVLWYREEGNIYSQVATWNLVFNRSDKLQSSSNIIQYLATTGWIIDLDEYLEYPHKYGELQIPDFINSIPNAWIIIPLFNQEDMDGFVVLCNPRTKIIRTWEDLDLLKTVGRLVASYLAQHESARKLVETEQFAAFNRLSAFVVHDLNNLVAQLGLVVRNAEKHKTNPAFMEDAIGTVQNAVKKMERLLAQLKKGRFAIEKIYCFDAGQEIKNSLSNLKGGHPQPKLIIEGSDFLIEVDKDRFISVIEHIIRNAQEAADKIDAYIEVRVISSDGTIVIQLKDNGCGMSEDFIRKRLYRPFETTKGNAGMGIGVYESKQFVLESEGTLDVDSVIGQGTTFTITLPLVEQS